MAKPRKYLDISRPLRNLAGEDFRRALILRTPLTDGVTVTCEAGHEFTPPWDVPLPSEMHAHFDDGAIKVPDSIGLVCPRCAGTAVLTIPNSWNKNGDITMYGDEAYHYGPENSYLFYVYAFMGCSAEYRRAVFKDALDTSKRVLRPSIEPDTWIFHAKDLRSEQWRMRNNVTCSTSDVNEQMRVLLNTLKTKWFFRDLTVTTHKSTLGGFSQQDIRAQTLYSSLYVTTDHLTENGFNPAYVLEATTAGTPLIDLDVERVGRSLHRDMSFAYLTRGNAVRLPYTVPKTAIVELELADLVAYWVNRYFWSRSFKKDQLVDLGDFGMVHWIDVNPVGIRADNSFHYPWPVD